MVAPREHAQGVHHVGRRPTLDVVRHAVRGAVCVRCYRRPPGSERLGPDVPRSCERGCAVFQQLPRVKRMAEELDPTLRPRAAVLNHLMHHICQQGRAAGRRGRKLAARWCPLSRYRDVIAREVDKLLLW